jgi:hypothetical protein
MDVGTLHLCTVLSLLMTVSGELWSVVWPDGVWYDHGCFVIRMRDGCYILYLFVLLCCYFSSSVINYMNLHEMMDDVYLSLWTICAAYLSLVLLYGFGNMAMSSKDIIFIAWLLLTGMVLVTWQWIRYDSGGSFWKYRIFESVLVSISLCVMSSLEHV